MPQKLSFQKMLATDLDGTLIGDDESMRRLLDSAGKNNILLSFITGRDLRSVKDFIKEKKIEKPDFSICMVGTEIYYLKENRFFRDKRWEKTISGNWQRDKIVKSLKGLKELKPQPKRWQTKLKISYFLRENQEKILKEIKERLNKSGLKTKIIYSCDKFLDFLPEHSSKAGALNYLIKKNGLKKSNIVVAGDSGNDLELFMAGFKGIIVANASRELKNYKGGNSYHANTKYSAGIIEGLKRWNFI